MKMTKNEIDKLNKINCVTVFVLAEKCFLLFVALVSSNNNTNKETETCNFDKNSNECERTETYVSDAICQNENNTKIF